eukprot:Em0018g288a
MVEDTMGGWYTSVLISLVFPVVASIAGEDQLPYDLHEQRGSTRGPESTPDPQGLHSAFKKGASIPPPGTPTIQTVNISAVLITWTYPPNLPSPVYFYVQCSIDGDPFANVSGLVPYTSGVTPSYVYRGLLFQAFYQFQVLASYAGESSNPSGTSNAFINGVTAPSGPPTNIRVIKVTSVDVDLVWKRPDFPIFASFIYTLYWGTARNELEQSEIIMDVTSTVVPNLRPNTTYFFAMVAMLSGFPSVLSDIVSTTTPLPALGQVSIVGLKSSQSWVWLQWTAPPPSPYLILADQYTVLYSGGGLKRLLTVSGQIQSATVAGLDPGMLYEFQVSYTSGGFPGPLSEPSGVSTLQVGFQWSSKPKATVGIYFVFLGTILELVSGPNCYLCKPLYPSSLLIEWENPSVMNETLTLYEVAGNVSSTLAVIPLEGNGSYIVGGLHPYTQHQFWIGLGTSYSWCPLDGCRTIQQAIPVLLSSPLAFPPQDWGSLICCWARGGVCLEYNDSLRSSNQNSNANGIRGVPEKGYAKTCSNDGPTKKISDGNKDWSSVELGWKPPLPTQQNGPITGYVVEVVQMDGGGGGAGTLDTSQLLLPHRIQTLNVSELCVQVTGLQPFSSYSFVVTAGTVAGFGPGSDPMVVSAQELGPPYNQGHRHLLVTLSLLLGTRGITFPAGVVTPLRVNVTGCLLRYDSGAAGNGNGTVEVAGGGTELRLGSGLLQRGTEYAISLTMEGLYDGVQLSFTSGPVNVTCPDCSGSHVQAWMVIVSSLVGVLVAVTLAAIPTAIYCWKCKWKRRPLPHSYLMDDHTWSEDTPSMDDLSSGDIPPVDICSEVSTPNSADQRIVIGASNEASPTTQDNTSVASDDELAAEPLLGRQHIPSLLVVMGGVHESSAFNGLNNQDYQLHDILQGTRYAPEGCSSSSSNSSTSVSDIASN